MELSASSTRSPADEVDSPLAIAAYKGQVDSFEKLLDIGFDPLLPCFKFTVAEYNEIFSTPTLWSSPLHFACMGTGNPELIRLLVEKHQADTNLKDDNEIPPLIYVISGLSKHKLELVKYLIGQGANKEGMHLQINRSALQCSILRHQWDICEYLVSIGCDVNKKDVTMKTPLSIAVCENCAQTCRLLLDAGANVYWEGINQETLVHLAVERSSAAVLRLLCGHGVDARRPDSHGVTPLQQVAEMFRYRYNKNIYCDIIKCLILDFNVDLNGPRCEGELMFRESLQTRRDRLTEIILNAGYNPILSNTSKFVENNLKYFTVGEGKGIYDKVLHMTTNPRCLRELCIFRIRKHFGTHLHKNISLLSIPRPLQDLISLHYLSRQDTI